MKVFVCLTEGSAIPHAIPSFQREFDRCRPANRSGCKGRHLRDNLREKRMQAPRAVRRRRKWGDMRERTQYPTKLIQEIG